LSQRLVLSSELLQLSVQRGLVLWAQVYVLDARDVLRQLVEVHVAERVTGRCSDAIRVFHVLLYRGQLPFDGGNGSDLRRGEEYIGAFAQTVREVTGRGRHHRAFVRHASLIPHAQRATRHLRSGSHLSIHGVVAFVYQLHLIHSGRRSHPQPGGQLAFELGQQLTRSYMYVMYSSTQLAHTRLGRSGGIAQ
jgi:hypothetical protein